MYPTNPAGHSSTPTRTKDIELAHEQKQVSIKLGGIKLDHDGVDALSGLAFGTAQQGKHKMHWQLLAIRSQKLPATWSPLAVSRSFFHWA